MCFGCSKEPSHRDGSFEYLQHMFWLRNKKNNFQLHTLIFGPVTLTNNSVICFSSQMHEEKKVKFHFQAGIKEFLGENGKVTEAVLSTGTKIPADICILGVGKLLLILKCFYHMMSC